MNKFIEHVQLRSYVRNQTPAGRIAESDSPVKDSLDPSPDAELRQLVADLLEVSADGRRLAADLSRTIRDIVGVQCDAIDERARRILARAEEIGQAKAGRDL
jgi:hypothetical protein